jgi:hypothetical protein
LGNGFEVLEPLELREKIYNIGKSIAKNHLWLTKFIRMHISKKINKNI